MVNFEKIGDRLLKEVEGVEVINGIAYKEVTLAEIEENLANIRAEKQRLEAMEEELLSFLPAEEGSEDSEEEDSVEEESASEEAPQY